MNNLQDNNMEEKKNIGGRLAANFRRANISEGLAIQMFRPFCAVSPFPREEDFGIDFIGTLIKKDGRTYLAEDSFAVQIKTVSSPVFSFSGNGVEWLKNLKTPYFPVIVDLNNGKISIFSLNRYHMPLFASAVKVYNFVVQNEFNEGDGMDDFPLGNPIMEWNLADCTHPDFHTWAYNIFTSFVKIESNNFKYGNLWRFETFQCETYTFDSSKVINEPLKISTELTEISPGNAKVILSTMHAVIGPFANWASNQPSNYSKGESLLNLRESLRELSFDPDPENRWDDKASDM